MKDDAVIIAKTLYTPIGVLRSGSCGSVRVGDLDNSIFPLRTAVVAPCLWVRPVLCNLFEYLRTWAYRAIRQGWPRGAMA